MLPLQLTLKNFMSYGEEPTTVDFRGMGLVCLSGDNGHGKSALLDAITWTLWGETRLGKQNHEQLIRLGADEMSAVFEFQEGGQTYRVRRQRNKRSSGQLWEVQILEASGVWRAITGQGSGDTGRTITQLLRMNYETFLNSAYLRQGRADEFVRQTANKRKEILAEILDLSRYDDLEVKSRTRMREAADRALDANRAIQQIDAELSQEAALRLSIGEVERRLAESTQRQADLTTRIEQLSELRATLTVQSAKLSEAEQQIAALDQQIRRQKSLLAAELATIEESQKLLADRIRIETAFERYESAQGKIEPLQIELRHYRLAQQRRVECEHLIHTAQRELEMALRNARNEHVELTSALSDLPRLQDRIAVLQASQTQYVTLQQHREALWDDQKSLNTQFAELAADKKRCDADLKAALERMDNIAAQDETCAICGSPLPQEKLDRLAEECAEAIAALETRQIELKREGLEVRSRQKHVEEDLAAAEAEMKRLEERRVELATLDQRASDLVARRDARMPGLEREISRLAESIEQRLFASDIQTELARLLTTIERGKVSEAHLTEAESDLKNLRWVEKAHAQLQNAEREEFSARGRMDGAQLLIDSLTIQHRSLTQSLADKPILDRQIGANARDLNESRSQSLILSEEIQRAQRDHGRLQHQIEHIDKIRILRAEREAEYQKAKNEEDLYAMLSGSFSKRGVQALIIENALPELETDANELLEKLTDGQMSITIQTTRQSKSRTAAVDAPIETLEVVISDYLGSRPLEMYSGGESFRVSFALRIALSKLLARRAGAHLQTLIIDEGFGTQDAKGREKLVDSIVAIQNDFAQIIVITHVDELKDAFPNRIEVTKTPTGSEISVVSGAALG